MIIQPEGHIPEYIKIENLDIGPTVDDKNIWIPQITIHEETEAIDFGEIDIDKFCGIPAFCQNNIESINGTLLLQLHTNWLPFYINAGASPTMYVFLDDYRKNGFVLIEDL